MARRKKATAPVRTKADELALSQGCYFDQSAADRVKSFAKLVYMSKGSWQGEPFHLLQWQEQFIDQLFGWKKKDQTRRFNRVWLSIAKGAGKSTFMSLLNLYFLLADEEPSPFIVCCANDRYQASIIFDEALRMVRLSPRLRDVLHATPSTKELHYPKAQGVFKAISSDVPSKHGLDCSVLVFDEIAFLKDRELFDTLKWATSKDRKQGLQVYTSTAGYDKTSVGYELYQYSKQILDGNNLDTTFLPVIYEPDEGDPIEDLATWKKANPGLGQNLSLEQFKQDFEQAKFSTSSLLAWKRLRLNLWTENESVWLPLDQWDNCKGTLPDLTGKPCTIGVDLASTTDLTAVVACWPIEGRVYIKSWAWVPEDAAKHTDRPNYHLYQSLKAEGLLTITPGSATDYNLVRQLLVKLHQAHKIHGVVFDKWNSTHLANEVQQDLRGVKVYNMPQTTGYYSAPCKLLESLVADRLIVHQADNNLRWQLGNVTIEVDSMDCVKPSKKKSVDKIDSVCALLMALYLLPELTAKKQSIYSTRGVISV